MLIYKKKHKTRNGIDNYLYLVLKSGKTEKFIIKTTTIYFGYDTEPIDFTNIILEKNKNVLVGKTKKNKEFILKKYGITI